jgi:hypothetical protein
LQKVSSSLLEAQEKKTCALREEIPEYVREGVKLPAPEEWPCPMVHFPLAGTSSHSAFQGIVPLNLYAEAVTQVPQNETVFGDRAF